MSNNLNKLVTELRSEHPEPLDTWSSLEIVKKMNQEDRKVPEAVGAQLDSIAEAVDRIVDAFDNGGRLFYFGAGTSGRLGVLDASECPPTFGTDPELVQGVIAGGESALLYAIEGAEDSFEGGVEDVHKHGVKAGDILVGIAASGRTPYVLGAMSEARKIGAGTVSLSCNSEADLNELADVSISVVVGPEIVSGSTRLKAGTAQKLVLNMLSTASMIRIGKVYDDLMVNVQATNFKLRERAKRIVMEATGASMEQSEKLLAASAGDCKTAIVMQLRGVGPEEAKELLRQANGRVRLAVQVDHTAS